jgi:hypothetical protein
VKCGPGDDPSYEEHEKQDQKEEIADHTSCLLPRWRLLHAYCHTVGAEGKGPLRCRRGSVTFTAKDEKGHTLPGGTVRLLWPDRYDRAGEAIDEAFPSSTGR